MKQQICAFWDWIDTRAVIRRIVLFVTLWMTWRSFTWAAEFAATIPLGQPGVGVDSGAIIAAVTAPIAALQGYVFKVYSEARNT